ncbi:MAG: DUF3857 and transglutaminase domain-containing protein [Bacteroidetes bacterium]|nr:DUF3857 and transglutaminase domain-containing protein [Bacteroidota bacterium]
MRYYLMFFCFLSLCFRSQKFYKIDSIPSILKENVDAVIRLDKTEFKIKDKGKAILNTHFVITIFNERVVNSYLKYYTHYDRLINVIDISGKVYDKNGDKIYKLSKKDIYDISSTARSNDITDGRIKVAEFGKEKFQIPYTIEFESSVETTNMMFYPSVYFYPSERLSTQEKTLIIETPNDFEFRYKEKKMLNALNLVITKNKKIYNWTVKNILASEYETHTPDNFYPEIVTAPKIFGIENYEGDLESWNDIGKFLSKLNQGRDVLPEAIKLKVADLVSHEKDTLKKIEILYQYLQNNTRYISIQLGVGGWQTIPAKDVAQTGYGDCKALSNYMKALLKEAGITSYSAWINSGVEAKDIDPDFPSMCFNHVVNCVPLKNDTIWLEITSQTNSFGFMGSFTGNRKALLILPNGAALVNTIKYNARDNSKITKATVVLDDYTNADVKINTTYNGILKEHKDYLLQEKNEEQLKKALDNLIHVASFELKKFTLTEHKNKIPSMQVTLDVMVKKMGNKSGSLFFFNPNLLNSQAFLISDRKPRKSDFYLNPNTYEKEEIDSLSYLIPKNIVPENLPEPVSIKTPFGEYESSVNYKDGTLWYYRKLVQHSGYFAVKDYSAYREFCKFVNKNDNQQIAFKIVNK